MKIFAALAALTLAAAASATQPPKDTGNTANGGNAQAGAISASRAEAKANAAAIAAQRQSQRSNQRTVVKVENTVVQTAPADKGQQSLQTVKDPNAKEPAPAAPTVVPVDYGRDERPVSTAWAPPLAASPETCMGSSSGGIQGASLGVSLGSTWESEGCELRMFARSLQALSLNEAAFDVLCQSAKVRAALEGSTKPCRVKSSKTAAAPAGVVGSALAAQTGGDVTDPYVRARLGLPPL